MDGRTRRLRAGRIPAVVRSAWPGWVPTRWRLVGRLPAGVGAARLRYAWLFKGIAVATTLMLVVSLDGGAFTSLPGKPPTVHGPEQAWASAKGRGHLAGGRRNRREPTTLRAKYPRTPVKRSAQPPRNTAKVAEPPPVDEAKKASSFDAKTSKELPGSRSSHARTFANADGTQSTEFSTRPINFQHPDGTWAPIDTRAVPVGRDPSGTAPPEQGWRNAADSVDIRLAPGTGGASPLVRMALGVGQEIGYSMQASAGVSGVAGAHGVTYRGVDRDTDLKVDLAPTGVKETIVLRSPRAPRSFVFPLALKGLTARMAGGQVEFADASGRTRAIVPPGFMTDSADSPATSTKVSYSLVTAAGGAPALRVDADAAWLRDPDRRFPVKVDPSVEISTAGTSMSVNDGGSTGGSQELTIGRRSAAYLAFPQLDDRLRHHRIFGAHLWMVNYDSATCRARPVTVHPVTQSWVGQSGLSYPGPSVGSALTRRSFNYGHIAFGATRSRCPTKGVDFNLGVSGRNLIQRWVNGQQANRGLSVRDASSDGSGYKKFTGHDTANPPRLLVTHSAYNAKYAITAPVPDPPVTQAQSGKIKITVTNTGAETWTPSTYYLGYRVYDKKGKLVTQQRSANLTGNVARGGSVKLDAVIKPLKPGTYSIDFTMVHTGGPVFIDEQVPPARLIIKIIDIPPVLQELYPPNGYQAPTLTPQLWATAVDLDPPPGSALSYKYEVCERAADGSATGCRDSGYVPTHAWTVPAGRLSWNKTYLWRVFVKDTGNEVPSPRVTLLTSVPQPEITSQLAEAGAPDKQFAPHIGNYTTAAVDASVGGAGPQLSVERTYNSQDPRRDLLFGAGWVSRYDMRLIPDQDGSGNVVVGYPDGQQVRYGKNPDGTFAPPPGRQATLTVDASGRWKLVDRSGTAYEFATGRLVKITDSAYRSLILTYNPNDGKLPSARPA